jgi:hypothetical protein
VIEIRHRYANAVLFRSETASTLRAALEQAVAVGARLDGARLDGARLDGARLDGASLDGASLDGARLDGASLDGASLVGASLDGARLDGASLDGASLVGASLVGASLVGARLDGAWLDPIGNDLYDILDQQPAEVPGLLAALEEGRIDGSTYDGACACLVGTIANVKGCDYKDLIVKPDAERSAEIWFLAIHKGDTPKTNPIAAITADWIREWLAERSA